jgi:hypothetical protein
MEASRQKVEAAMERRAADGGGVFRGKVRIEFVLVSDFDFELPEELIAQAPPAERSGARMLRLGSDHR